MQTPMRNDDIWTRQGVSLIWDADLLRQLCTTENVISLRQFRQLHSCGWSGVEPAQVDEVALVVAGIEGCIDALSPDEASDWLRQAIYNAIVSYQSEVSYGGDAAALVLWIVDAQRLDYRTSEDQWYWHCGGEHQGEQVPIGRCLFNGAASDLKEIQDSTGKSLGLFIRRIS
jgi:hypothetical protein